jgi:hypothetical protein
LDKVITKIWWQSDCVGNGESGAEVGIENSIEMKSIVWVCVDDDGYEDEVEMLDVEQTGGLLLVMSSLSTMFSK